MPHIRAPLRTSTASVESVPASRICPSRLVNPISRPQGGSNSTESPTPPAGSPEPFGMAAPSDSLGHRAPAKSNIHLFAWQRRNATECASFACRPLTPDPVLDPQNLNALVVFPVACHHTRSMRQRGRGDHEVGVSHAPSPRVPASLSISRTQARTAGPEQARSRGTPCCCPRAVASHLRQPRRPAVRRGPAGRRTGAAVREGEDGFGGVCRGCRRCRGPGAGCGRFRRRASAP